MGTLRKRHEPMPPRAVGSTLADRLDYFADQISRLRMENRDPEAFHVNRDALFKGLRDLAQVQRKLAETRAANSAKS